MNQEARPQDVPGFLLGARGLFVTGTQSGEPSLFWSCSCSGGRWASLEESDIHLQVSSLPREEIPGLACFAGLLTIVSSSFNSTLLCVTAPALCPVPFFSSLECKLREDSLALAFLSLASRWSAQWMSGGYGLILLNSC